MGEEDPILYNERVDAAFEARRIIAWPFAGPITIEEVSKDKHLREEFVIDNWCLIAGSRKSNRFKQNENSSTPHRFDYDTYKLLYCYIMDEANKTRIQK